MKRIISIILALMIILTITGCDESVSGSKADVQKTIDTANTLQEKQPTPTDFDYSLERYNLIRRAYWVNGQREKARTYPCPIADVPLGYVVLFTNNGGVVGRFVVEGKVSSLNSYLTPDSEYYESPYNSNGNYGNKWLADIDGSYGENDSGIFFFTPDGKYIEWTSAYLYSDIPFIVDDPVVKVGAANE